ncbi:FAS1-like dehydratase domain-containing protein [Actinoallomurus acaciae]|uniref:MaoC family dehydratase N-terminal domain-containing protein n=1 Tax=Actinoallomurus acaciae TaxID=502577 RepID=A0ABV5YPG9_9ACTN
MNTTTAAEGLKEARYELVTVPEEFGPVRVRVDEAKVLGYAFAQADFGAWHFGDSPFGGPVAHPLVLANDLLFLFYQHYDGNTARGLHTHERLTFHAPIRVGETVTITGAYTDKYERRGQGYVVLEAEARGEDGRLLVTHHGREIMRTRAGDVVGRSSAGARGRRVRGETDPSLGVAERPAAGLVPGTALPALTRRFDQDQMNAFSWAGRGFVNVHTSAAVAAEQGLDRTIVQAQQQTGVIVTAMTRFFGAAWFTSGSLDLRFVRPALCGDELTVHAAVCSQDDRRLELEVWVTKPDGTGTARGWASANGPEATEGPVSCVPGL